MAAGTVLVQMDYVVARCLAMDGFQLMILQWMALQLESS